MKILFLQVDSFSHVNKAVVREFEIMGHEVEIFDVGKYVHPFCRHAYPFRAPRMITSSLLTYGRELKQGYKKTVAAFDIMSDLCEKRVARKDFDVIFQTQALFGLVRKEFDKPYFIYTDYTHSLNNELKNSSVNYAPVNVDKGCMALESIVYRTANHIFVFSNTVRRNLVESYNISDNKVTVVGAGPNTAIPENPNKNNQGRNILFVGIDFERKGGKLLLEAFAKVKAEIPGATLTIIGASPNVDGSNIKVMGRVPLSVVEQEYRNADIFVLPSYLEPFGASFLEAMSYELPCIRSDIESISDHVREGVNGDVMANYSPDDLANKIINLLRSRDTLKRYGKAGRMLVLEKYNWTSVVKRIVTIIEMERQ